VIIENYSVWDHGSFLRDRIRVSAYSRALSHAIFPGAVVLEIGTGTGFFAALAARYGAEHVDAIEADPVIHAARGVLEDNGLEDRVTLYRGTFDEFRPMRAYDVILSDLRGALPFFGANIAVAMRSRRNLAEDGVLIPHRDRVYVAPCGSQRLYRPYSDPWTTCTEGISLGYCLPAILRHLSIVFAEPGDCLAEAALWADVQYLHVDSTDHRAQIDWILTRPGDRHLTGFVAWFESDLTDEVSLSNRPGEAALVYGQLFFPLARPVEVRPGANISLDLSAALEDGQYRWAWSTTVSTDRGRVQFDQLTHSRPAG